MHPTRVRVEGILEESDDKKNERAEAFGREFGALIRRLNDRCEPRIGDEGGPEPAESRRTVAATLEREVEQLISKHRVPEPVAEYVRHVVREGFDVDFDLMDPTDGARRARREPPEGTRRGSE